MEYKELLMVLLSQDVYHCLKQKEEEIFVLIPELKNCKGFDQRSCWHIYDVYEHILHVVSEVDAMIPLRLAALFHDVGKPLAFTLDAEGHGHFWGHWERSVEIFQKYAQCFELSKEEIDLLIALIFYHDVNIEKMSDEEIEKMVKRIGVENIGFLFAIKRADLLAQASEYHGLLANIQKQEERIQDICKH